MPTMSTEAHNGEYAARQAWLDDLAGLDMDPEIGAATWRAFGVLWHLADRRPGQLCISASWLGQLCGHKTRRAARKWLDQLAARGLVSIVETDRRGVITLYLFRPAPSAALIPRGPDPQARFPFMAAAPSAATQRDLSAHGDDTPRDVSAPKGPAPETLENKGFSEDFRGGRDVSAPKGPGRSMYTKKDTSNSTTLQSNFNDSMNTMSAGGGASAGNLGLLCAAAIDRAADRLASMASPQRQRAALKARILRSVRPGPNGPLEDSCAGRAANLVVYQSVPIELLDAILAEIAGGQQSGNLTNPPGAFHRKVHKLAGRYGVAWTAKERAMEKV